MRSGDRYSQLIDGAEAALPIVLGYIPIGLAFGVLAVQQGLGVPGIFVMSLIVYAGSAQFIATGMLAAGASVTAIVATTFLVNLRHLLMSASMSAHLRRIHPVLQAIISFGITDETFAVGITAAQDQKRGAGFFLGLHAVSQVSWVISTVIGGLVGNLVPEPERFGLDFALPAMFVGLLLMQLRDRKELIVAVISGAVSVGLAIGMKGNWNIILATVIGASVGAVAHICQQKSSLPSQE